MSYDPESSAKRTVVRFLLMLAAVFAVGCSSQRPVQMGQVDARDAAAPQSASKDWLEGSVTEVIDAGDYRYLCVTSGRESVWMATSLSDLSVGDDIEYQEGLLMSDFESPTLHRTFPRILFVDHIRVTGRTVTPIRRVGGLPSGHPVVPQSTRSALRRLPVPPQGSLPSPDGTVPLDRIVENQREFSGKKVRVVGFVTKINRQILGQNWVHLEDERGSELIVTTSVDPGPGAVVLAEGTLVLGKTFKTGYFVPLLLEAETVKPVMKTSAGADSPASR